MMRQSLIALTATLVTTAAAAAAIGAPGDRDPAFGTNGVARLDLGDDERADTLLLQPDGRILVAGRHWFSAASGYDAVVARFVAPQGTLDPTYGGGAGWSRIDFSRTDGAGGLAQLPDGRILVAGSREPGMYHPAPFLGRLLNPQGVLDGSFRGTGTNDFTGGPAIPGAVTVEDLVLRPDGSMLMAGSSGESTYEADMFLARLTPSGGLDTAFGPFGNGAGWTTVGLTDVLELASTVIEQPDGDVLLVGRQYKGRFSVAVGRVDDVTALPDFTFGGASTGVAVHSLGRSSGANDGVLEPDGRITVAGWWWPYGTDANEGLVARLMPDGRLDESFAGTGVASVPVPSEEVEFHALVRQPDGKLVAVGETEDADYDTDVLVARLTADGRADATFGSGGVVRVELGGEDSAADVVLQPDGAILVAATSRIDGDDDMVLVRLLGDPAPVPPAPAGTGAGPMPVPGAAAPRATPGGGTPAPPLGAGGATASCGGRVATIVGTAGRDRLRGSAKADVIAALAGDDVVAGLGGDDIVCGGPGNDSLAGGAGFDRLLGGAGKDALAGGPGKDSLLGGAGVDRLTGGPGVDTLVGGAGKDVQAQ